MGVWQGIKAVAKRVTGAPQGNDPNFGSSMQMYTPGQPIWSDKNYATFVRSGYKKNPTVYACINKIASTAAGIEWRLYTDRAMVKTYPTHSLLDLWRKPNPSVPGSGSFVELCFGFWHMSGNNYIWSYRPSPEAPPLALWPLRPDRMKAVAGNNKIENYVYGYQTSDPQIYEIPDILHMKFPAYDDDIYGLSPIEVASYFADQNNEAMGWNTSLMQNAGRPASVFFAKNYLTPEQREQIKAELRRKYSGKRNAGMPLILESDMTWQNMSLSPMELDWLKSRELNTRDIAAIFDIAPELIGDSAGKTFANVAEARQALYLENVLPKLDRFRDYLNSWLVPMYPDLKASGAFFSYDQKDIEALQGLYQQAKDATHARARADWMAGGITLDEYRDAIGMKPAKYGKVYRIGLVVVSEDSMEDYADQSLEAPATAPVALPEPLNIPGADPNQLALPPGTHPNDAAALQAGQTGKKPAKPAPAKKTMDVFGIYQPDDLEKRLAAYRAAGVTHLMWSSGAGACDACQLNDGQIVALGQPFASGHILPPAHPNCNCQVFPAAMPMKNRLQALALELGIQKMLELVEMYKLNGGYKVHEEIGATNKNQTEKTEGREDMQLRPLQVQATQDRTQEGEHCLSSSIQVEEPLIINIDACSKRSGDIYREWISRYN